MAHSCSDNREPTVPTSKEHLEPEINVALNMPILQYVLAYVQE